MKNFLNSIKLTKPKKNMFDLSHDVKLSLNMGQLVPIMVQECIPGDKYNISCESLLRFAPLTAPVMHKMDVTMHYFFVPNRILWNNWENFITNTQNPPPGGLPAFPYMDTNAEEVFAGSLADYLGLPNGAYGQVSALPFAAYAKIYNEYYRDQNLVPKINDVLVDGDNTSYNIDMLNLRYRAWEHDYFTAALPFAQKGDAVTIPMGGLNENAQVYLQGGAGDAEIQTNTAQDIDVTQQNTTGIQDNTLYAETQGLNVEPGTINDLRRAYKLQEWLEKNARGGTRYVENILSHFGVKSSDARLQRPEYITGTKSPVQISEVLSTTGSFTAGDPTEATSLPVGNMAGHGVSVTSGQYGSYFCEEHGWIIGIMSVMPNTAYQQGVPRHYSKFENTDYYWPSFAHIGEQEVLNKEIYAEHSSPNGTFGYMPRYAEYRYNPSRVAGDFKTSLSYWHLGRIFDVEPSLNQQFIECKPSDRIFAVEDPTVNKLYAHVLNKVQAIRPIPKFGTPSF